MQKKKPAKRGCFVGDGWEAGEEGELSHAGAGGGRRSEMRGGSASEYNLPLNPPSGLVLAQSGIVCLPCMLPQANVFNPTSSTPPFLLRHQELCGRLPVPLFGLGS